MFNFLQAEKATVAAAQDHLNAVKALDSHCNKVAKAQVKQLLLSPKGLGTAFGLGAAKGWLDTNDSPKTKAGINMGQHVLRLWFA